MVVASESVAPLKLQHDGHNVPITALAFADDNFILVGQGNYLGVYDIRQALSIASWQIFPDQAIHGIAKHKSTTTILIWSGQLIRVARIDHRVSGSIELLLGVFLDVKDWTFDIAFCDEPTHDSKLSAAVVTAHNALTLVQILDSARSDRITANIVPLTSDTNSILYTAHIKWLSASQCLIASGTAFGDIILWSGTISCNSGVFEAETQIHYTFCAHEGSVFGVQLSEPVILPGRVTKSTVLASCSDDRTIRLWDVSDLSKTSSSLVQMQSGTGFGSKLHEKSHTPPCLAETMGHISRIWDVRFAQSSRDGINILKHSSLRSTHLPTVVSLGEDATAVLWGLVPSTSLGETGTFTLKQISTVAAHRGKNIWAITLSKNNGVITGGADGSIVVSYEDAFNLSESQVCGQLTTHSGENESDLFRCYAFVGHGVIIAITHQGYVARVTIDERRETTMNAVPTPQSFQFNLRGYSLACGFNGGAVVGGKGGALWLYEESSKQVSEVESFRSKVMGLFSCHSDRNMIYLLATCITPSDPAVLICLHVDPDSGEIAVVVRKKLCLPSRSIVSSFTCSSTKLWRHYLVGCRDGSFVIFEDCSTEDLLKPISLVASAHHKEAVTSLLTRPDSNITAPSYFVYSLGRDGTIAVHQYTSPRVRGQSSIDETSATLLHRIALPLGPNIEQLEVSSESHLWASGFQGKEFIVYDVTTQRNIMRVECGGAHRNWVFQSSNFGGTFVWTKASNLYRHTQMQLPYHSINSGGHGREIKAVASSCIEPQIVATGAEDTNIKLHSCEGNGTFRCLQTLRKHTTGIQQLQWSTTGRYLFSSGGFEEFFIWRITPDVPIIGVAVVCESRYPRSGSSDLRIMGFDAKEKTTSGPATSHNFIISMAYSDSTVKIWTYDASGWNLVASSTYLTACLTSISFLDHETLLSTATDGHIALWHSGSKLNWTTRKKIHQNAILDIVSLELADGTTLLFTAGDDNAIGITRITPAHNCGDGAGTREGEGEVDTLLIPRAHAAAVTALSVFPLEPHHLAENDKDNVGSVASHSISTTSTTSTSIPTQTPTIIAFLLISVSTDQRLKTWQVRLDSTQPGTDGIEIRRLGSVHTAVADVAGLSTLTLAEGGTGVLVCGVGMDVWKLPREIGLRIQSAGR